MKKIKLLMAFVVAFFFTITNVYAEIEVNRVCSIIGKYNYSDFNITDTNVYLYKIADMNEMAEFTYIDGFTGFTTDINKLQSFEWNDYTIKINKYITDNNINYITSTKTDNNGQFTFKDLKVGLYLIRVDSKKTKDYEYSSGPLLVSLPNYNEIQDIHMYDLNVFVKTEAKSLNVNPGGGVNPPYTADSIYVYVAIFGIALVIFIITIILILKKKKKSDEVSSTNVVSTNSDVSNTNVINNSSYASNTDVVSTNNEVNNTGVVNTSNEVNNNLNTNIQDNTSNISDDTI